MEPGVFCQADHLKAHNESATGKKKKQGQGLRRNYVGSFLGTALNENTHLFKDSRRCELPRCSVRYVLMLPGCQLETQTPSPRPSESAF